jgi:hypothetical protein
MKVLNGWKEIAASLNLTSRTARRWEQLGLPVRRVSDSSRSPIVASSDEIELWVRSRRTKLGECDSLRANKLAFRKTRGENRKLLAELKLASTEHRRLLETILDQLGSKSHAPSGSTIM